jgi:hypothetical protein
VAVILEAVHAALRIFLHVSTGHGIAVVVGVLLALAVAGAVVGGVVGRVDAVLAWAGLLMPWVTWSRKLGVLRAKDETVWADGSERGAVSTFDTAHAQRENHGEYDACCHERWRSNRLSTRCWRDFRARRGA